MIGPMVSNVLVRYLTQDDPIQSPKAADLIERALTESEPGYISIVAMVETTWVLERTYEFSATDIAVAIERMLQASVLTVENEQRSTHRHDSYEGASRIVFPTHSSARLAQKQVAPGQ